MTGIAQPLNLQRATVVLMVRDRIGIDVAPLAVIRAHQPTVLQGCGDAGMCPSSLWESLAPFQRVGAHADTAIRLITLCVKVFWRLRNAAAGTDFHLGLKRFHAIEAVSGVNAGAGLNAGFMVSTTVGGLAIPELVNGVNHRSLAVNKEASWRGLFRHAGIILNLLPVVN